MGKKIRGLRRCTQRDCMLPLNRDKNGATNIGTNFMRLFEDKTPVRSINDDDLAFHVPSASSVILSIFSTTPSALFFNRVKCASNSLMVIS